MLLLLLLACGDPQSADTPCKTTTFYVDLDGDGYGGDADTISACATSEGYAAVGGDCDDDDPSVVPGGVELCDGDDDDCDGEIDEDDALDPDTWHADADGDGFGDPDITMRVCAAPDGYVADASDCDDADPDVFPGADELCDGDDDDCDAQVDEDDAVGAPTWYADLDRDGYGDPDAPAAACEPPALHVDDATDCDDLDARDHPGATETCDGEDDDCDGIVDEDPSDGTTWYADADSDGYGGADLTTAACEAPEGYTAAADDCDDTDAGTFPGGDEHCDGLDEDCDGGVDEGEAVGAPTWYADADGDGHGDASVASRACTEPAGYVAGADDCDDADPAISPDADELCDADDVDEDCDGRSDDDDTEAIGGSSWYADDDGDGFGDASVTVTACDLPAGHLADADDCDDGDADVSPDGVEVCNEIDDDCDGAIDDLDDDVVGAPTWYTDGDADGWGDAAAGVACAAPGGAVASDGDCDDTDATVSPGAEESCATTGDDDCDGDADELDAVGCVDLYVDADADGYGDGTAACMCAADATYTVSVDGDCDDADADVNPDAEEVCGDGTDEDCDGTAATCTLEGTLASSTADVRLLGDATAMAGGADLDDDGYDDVIIGFDETLYVAYGPLSSGYVTAIPTQVTSDASGDDLGYSIDAGIDVDGDGTVDWVTGAFSSDRGAVDGGAAYVFSGAPAAVSTPAAAAAAQIFEGALDEDAFGGSVALVADTDGDGYGGVLVGAYGVDTTGDSAGAAYLFDPPFGAARSASTADAVILGEDDDDAFGGMVADGADFDGDGLHDVFVTATGDDTAANSAGAVYVFTGIASGTLDASAYDLKILGTRSSEQMGYALDTGDIDADGLDDLIIGSSRGTIRATSQGMVYVIPGGLVGSMAASSAYSAFILGDDWSDMAGGSVAFLGDSDADGHADLLVGCTGYESGGSTPGAAGLFYGPIAGSYDFSDGDAILLGGGNGDRAGYPVAAAGDTDGDGFGDVLSNAANNDDVSANYGSIYLWLGASR